MAELFCVSLKTISEHLQNLFKSGELSEETVLRKSRITAADGKAYRTHPVKTADVRIRQPGEPEHRSAGVKLS
ncbi:hypothetical protein NKI41_27490, partial [Mesorhizobium sp. M0601]